MISNAKSEPAVSPVIGTILLVAITVVLVAIIVAVMMGFSNAEEGKKVGLNAQPSNEGGNIARLIVYGGESLSELIRLEMMDHDSPYGSYVEVWNGSAGTVNIGIPYSANDVAQPAEPMDIYDTRINVKGTFDDGREVVLLIQPMTFYDVDSGSNVPVTPPEPIVNIPYTTKTTYKYMTVEFTYENMENTPSQGVVYYRVANSGSGWTKKTADKIDGDTSGTYNVTSGSLTQNVDYEVLGAVVVDGTEIKGEPAILRIRDPYIVIHPQGTTTVSKNSVVVHMSYQHCPSHIHNGRTIVYCRLPDGTIVGQTTSTTYVSNGMNADQGYYAYLRFAEITGLESGTTYEIVAVTTFSSSWVVTTGPIQVTTK